MANEKRLIDADAEIEAIKKYACKDCESYNGIKCRACWADYLIHWIEDAPKVDVMEVVHGEWEITEDDYLSLVEMKCSVCGESYGFDFFEDVTPQNYHYCPNCGAKMDGDGNE